MDTAKLELAAQRCRDAEKAFEAARADLRAEAVAALRSTDEQGAPATVVRITGWRPAYLRGLLRTAEEQST